MTPIRIQRKRTAGWRKPEGTINCTRPGRYGNPFRLVGDMIYGDASHRRKILDPWIFLCFEHEATVVELYKDWIHGVGKYDERIIPRPFMIEELKTELKGHNLMCFCGPKDECHVDFLLELTNT